MQLRSLLIRLQLARGIGYQGRVRVLRHCLKHQVVLTTAPAISAVAQLTGPRARTFQTDWQSPRFAAQLAHHAMLDVLTIVDPEYPQRLLESFKPPLVLFLQGHRELLTTRTLAVVGARRASGYMPRCVRSLLTPLIQDQFTIISGLAAGTDGQAHATALALGLPTIAVIGTGLDVSYPQVNAALQRQIGRVGLLVSEYPLGTGPARYRFPERNRIIAGLCQTLLVIEARRHSGSLITANLALQNNRNVLAVPGPIDAPLSVGCNELIAAGAKPVLNSGHIIEEFLP